MRSSDGILRTIFFILLTFYANFNPVAGSNEEDDLALGSESELESLNPLLCQIDDDCENEEMICGSGGLCVCYDYDLTTYDLIKDICAIKVGKRCKSSDECVMNAVCDPIRHVCTCNGPDFSETSAGKCLGNFGTVCGGGCNPENHLTCRAGHCDCVNPAQQGYSKKEGRCIALPGEKCELKIYYNSQIRLHCGEHALCLRNNPQEEMEETSEVDSRNVEFFGTCGCDPGYAPVAPGNPDCMAMHGTICNSSDPCVPGHHLACDSIDGICKCDPPALLEETSLSSCALREGTACSNSKSICTQNAMCNEVSGKCLCRFGYSRTPIGLCKLDFDLLSCSPEKDNCNEFQGLICIGDKCGCRSPQIFDKVLRTCVNPVGLGGVCGEGKTENCPNNAFCNFENRECECQEPMMPKAKKSDGFCYPGFGAPCNISHREFLATCSGGNYLTCNVNASICECTSNAILENSTCFLRAEEKCRKEKEDTCVSRAICDESAGICKCVKGYAPDHGRCGLIHGKSCDPSANECNKEAFLSCLKSDTTEEYKCGCNAELGLIYDQSLKSCAVLIGLKCETNVRPKCIENSECASNICKCSHGFKNMATTNHTFCEPTIESLENNHNYIHADSTENANSIAISLKIKGIELFRLSLIKWLVFNLVYILI